MHAYFLFDVINLSEFACACACPQGRWVSSNYRKLCNPCTSTALWSETQHIQQASYMFHCLAASPCAPESDEAQQGILARGLTQGRFPAQHAAGAAGSSSSGAQHLLHGTSTHTQFPFSVLPRAAQLPRPSGASSKRGPAAAPASTRQPPGTVRSHSAGRGRAGGAASGGHALRLGICAREKKARSKPMREIVQRLEATGQFVAVVFTDEVLLKCPIDQWPRVDALIAFYSAGFPLDKAIAYVEATRPFCLNNLHMERVLRDRRLFYSTLTRNNIPVPKHVFCSRDGPTPPHVVEEEDFLEVDGVRIQKPFVEKPVDAEDHNVYIYYPRRLGGGSKRLFRKVGNRSSQFYRDISTVRRTGSFIYEEFVMTQGTDIKLYVVGPDYTHAEARKSPVVDGIVQRDSEGKELRFPILLTAAEKAIARRVCLAFKANVCGFDLLRMHSQSFVCDVNGWSFVKKSVKYYDDAAAILGVIMLRSLAPHRLKARPAGSMPGAARSGLPPLAMLMGGKRRKYSFQLSNVAPQAAEHPPSHLSANGEAAPLTGSSEQLRCVTAVFRHGDRTPKQKLKLTVTNTALLELMAEHAPGPHSEAKLKTAGQLQQALDVVRALLDAADDKGGVEGGVAVPTEGEGESLDKLRQVRAVLERGGAFSGVNRKVQLKPTKWAKKPTRRPSPARRRGSSRTTRSPRSLPQAAPGEGGSMQCAPVKLSDEVSSLAATAATSVLSSPSVLPVRGKKNRNKRRSTSFNTTLGGPSVATAFSKGRRSLRAASQDESEGGVLGGDEGGLELTPEDALIMGAHGASGLKDASTLDDSRMLARLRVLSGVPMDPALEAAGCRSCSVGAHVRHSRGASVLSLDAKLDRMTLHGTDMDGTSLFRLPGPAAERGSDAHPSQYESSSDGEEDVEVAVEATLVLKWGGVLTDRGRSQATALGQRFRQLMYPGESTALLRLHSTYRHDLKIYSSDEGRVQMTAACFVKGFLDLEGDLTPILASLVRYDNTGGMLDSTAAARPLMCAMKEKLSTALTKPGGYAVGEGGVEARPKGGYLSDGHLTLSSTTPALGAPLFAEVEGQSRRSFSQGQRANVLVPSGAGRSLLPGQDPPLAGSPGGMGGDSRPSALHLMMSDTDGSISGGGMPGRRGSLRYRGSGNSLRTSLSLTMLARAGGSPLLGATSEVGGGYGGGEAASGLSGMDSVGSTALLQQLPPGVPTALVEAVTPSRETSHLKALTVIGADPEAALQRLHRLILELTRQLRAALDRLAADNSLDPSLVLPLGAVGGGCTEEAAPPPPPTTSPLQDAALVLSAEPTPQLPELDDSLGPSRRPTASPTGSLKAVGGAVWGKRTGDPPLKSPTDGAALAIATDPAIGQLIAPRAMPRYYAGETLWLMHHRWRKLAKELFHVKKNKWDLSKLPDVYDCIKYDALHNETLLGQANLRPIQTLARAFADVIVPQEYGITFADKRDISAAVTYHLLRKLYFDVTAVVAPGRTATLSPRRTGTPGAESGTDTGMGDRIPMLQPAPQSTQPPRRKPIALLAVAAPDAPRRRPRPGTRPPPPSRQTPPAATTPPRISSIHRARTRTRGSSTTAAPPSAGASLLALPGANNSPLSAQHPYGRQRRLSAPEALESWAIEALWAEEPVTPPGTPGGQLSPTAQNTTPAEAEHGRSISGESTHGHHFDVPPLVGRSERGGQCPAFHAQGGQGGSPTMHPPLPSHSAPQAHRVWMQGDALHAAGTDAAGNSERETLHRLDGAFASDAGYETVRSPDTMVRTRLYFSSESHLNTLLNVLRTWGSDVRGDGSQGGGGASGVGTPLASDSTGDDILDEAARSFLSALPEIDYLTHIVFRLYENMAVAPLDPLRHRVEVLFSPGAALCPFDGSPREPFTALQPSGQPLSPAASGAPHDPPAPASAGPAAPPSSDASTATATAPSDVDGGSAFHAGSVTCLDPVVLVPALPLQVFQRMVVSAIHGCGGDLHKAM